MDSGTFAYIRMLDDERWRGRWVDSLDLEGFGQQKVEAK